MTHEVLAGYRVLVVEDDYFVAEELTAALQKKGAVVLGSASNVKAGRSLARELAPDCVLLDVSLRGESAFDLVGELAITDSLNLIRARVPRNRPV